VLAGCAAPTLSARRRGGRSGTARAARDTATQTLEQHQRARCSLPLGAAAAMRSEEPAAPATRLRSILPPCRPLLGARRRQAAMRGSGESQTPRQRRPHDRAPSACRSSGPRHGLARGRATSGAARGRLDDSPPARWLHHHPRCSEFAMQRASERARGRTSAELLATCTRRSRGLHLSESGRAQTAPRKRTTPDALPILRPSASQEGLALMRVAGAAAAARSRCAYSRPFCTRRQAQGELASAA
jgi:hypothetical protein